jgi:hypothetical protein
MFKLPSSSRKLAQRVKELEAQNAVLAENLENLTAAARAMDGRAYLFKIDRDGRTNKFTFVRGTELHVIETMGLLSDDIEQWRNDLGLKP